MKLLVNDIYYLELRSDWLLIYKMVNVRNFCWKVKHLQLVLNLNYQSYLL